MPTTAALVLLAASTALAGVRGDPEPPFTVTPTALLLHPADAPRTVLRVTLARRIDGELRLFEGADPADDTPFSSTAPPHNTGGASAWLPAPLPAVGETLAVTIEAGEDPPTRRVFEYARPDAGHVLHFVPGFHYDPVWWNTQAHYTETGRYLDAHTGPGITLVAEYLRKLTEDPDYQVAFHQLPYLKTFLEARPWRARELRSRVAEGRAGLVGGSYNELSSTLVSAESTLRNAVYGVLFQRQVLGGAATTFWQCDVFGHDPSFPSIMADSGHDAGAFARGPFHQWGIDRDQVNFPSEFLWTAPDGRSILTHYMTGHYGYAYARFATGATRAPDDPALSNAMIAEMFEDLRRPALTKQVLLPMHTDFVRPLENLGDVVRAWNQTYLSPRAVIGTSRDFFAAVRQDIARDALEVPVITRDMNPIYTGCAVSFADLKLANRAAEVALRDAELLATLAAIDGARYPAAAIDRAWRQLLFCAHHDGVTGSMSDQVYLDVMASYRDALSIAEEVRDRAAAFLEAGIHADATGDTVVWNTTARTRRAWLAETGAIEDIPAVGYRVLTAGETSPAPRDGSHVLENEHLVVEVDVERGGTLKRVTVKDGGRDVLRGPGNDLVVWQEYKTLPGQGEGPWHLAPTGERRSGADAPARLLPPDPSRPHRLVIESDHGLFRARRAIELPPGSRRIDFETTVLDWRGRDQLLRVEFPVDLPHARPVFETAAAVIGRNFARDVDAAQDPWTLDQSLWQFCELGTTCTLELERDGQFVERRPIAVASISLPEDASNRHRALCNDLAKALASCGVTSTIVSETERRYGDLTLDSNAPDIQFSVARHDHDSFGEPYVGVSDQIKPIPIVVISQASVADVCARLRDEHRVVVDFARLDPPVVADDFGVALISAGPASAQIRDDGTMALNLLRSNTSWPAGVWIDPPTRRLPDGAPMETMHGDHTFRYSLYPHRGDYRDAEVAREAQDVNQPLRSRPRSAGDGQRSATKSFLSVEPDAVLLTALKPRGFPQAEWRTRVPDPRRDGVIVRLWNGAGRSVEARLSTSLPVTRAWRTDLLERPTAELAVEDGAVMFTMQSHETATLWFELAARGDAAAEDAEVELDPVRGDTAPSAYWLENLGEGVTGNGEIALALERREVVLTGSGLDLPIHITNHRRDRDADLELSVVAPRTAAVTVGARRVKLAPSTSIAVPLRIDPREGIARRVPGLIEVRARVDGERTVTAAMWVASTEDDLSEAAIEVVPLAAVVAPGEPLRVRVTNKSDGEIRGRAAWLSPMAAWDAIPDWRRELTLSAGESVDWVTDTTAPLDSFALLRFTYGGRVAYSPAVALVRDPRRVMLGFDVDRVRLRKGEPSRVVVSASSAAGLAEDTQLELIGPDGLAISATSRFFRREEHDARLTVAFSAAPLSASGRGFLTARAPDGGESVVPFTVAPLQRARPSAAAIVIDGDLSDWSDVEFTRADGPRGGIAAAVRYGTAGLLLAVRVEDDAFMQTASDATIWQGDSVQVALSTTPGEALGYSERDFEFGAADTPVGPLVWCWYGGDGGRTGAVTDAKIAVGRGDGELRYEFTLPRSSLGRLPLKPGTTLGFSYIANDNDGEGYAGATEWTAGMVGAKDASLFGELLLDKE